MKKGIAFQINSFLLCLTIIGIMHSIVGWTPIYLKYSAACFLAMFVVSIIAGSFSQ